MNTGGNTGSKERGGSHTNEKFIPARRSKGKNGVEISIRRENGKRTHAWMQMKEEA